VVSRGSSGVICDVRSLIFLKNPSLVSHWWRRTGCFGRFWSREYFLDIMTSWPWEDAVFSLKISIVHRTSVHV